MTCRRNRVEGDVSRGAGTEFLPRDQTEETEEAVVLGFRFGWFLPSVNEKKKRSREVKDAVMLGFWLTGSVYFSLSIYELNIFNSSYIY